MTCVKNVIEKQEKKQQYIHTKYNDIIIDNDIAKIYLKNTDEFCIIDKEDIEKIMVCTWYGKKGDWDKYARGMINQKEYKMHRLIMDVTDPNIHVDHINGNTYDNRKENLRLCNNSTNHMNQRVRKDNSCGFKGVRKNYNKYLARIGKNGSISLGTYNSIIEAAEAYDKAAIKLYGQYAKLNFEEKREEYLKQIEDAH